MQLSLSTTVVALAALVSTVISETHTVRFNNLCPGVRTPILQARNGTILSTGTDYVSDGPLIDAIAYFWSPRSWCGSSGQGCTAVRTTLINRTPLRLITSTTFDVSPPFAFSLSAAFSYFGNGCEGTGGYCNGPACPGQNISVVCEEDDANLSITFCA